jgi:ABC-type polysaccharide/polyol phosphate export permease
MPVWHPRYLYQRLEELARFRQLLWNLVLRDLKVRYRNSVLGVIWSLLNPLLMTLVFTFVFTVMIRSGIEKFPVFLLCGLLPWNLFSASVLGSTSSILNNAPLVKKVYFPREVLPISVVLSNLVNFFLALIVLFGMILIFRVQLSASLLFLPLIIMIQIMFTLGVGLVLATANVFYRDTQMILEVVLLAWFFLTPVFYPITELPRQAQIFGVTVDVWLWTHRLNPMASLVAAYRDVLYYGGVPGLDFLFRTFVTALAVLVFGYLVFLHYGRTFGEEV